MSETRIIKRYANRKLYDTQHSRYVTLEQISEMIRNGDDVKIVDNKTKEDLTSVTLAQILFEEEKKQRSFLSLQTMRDLIQNGGESFASLVTQAQRRVTSILPRRKDEAEGEAATEPHRAPPAAHTPVPPESDAPDTTAGSKRHREGMASLREFREWVQQTQHTIDEWQKRVDHRIRDMVGGISPIHGLQKDVKGLASRIAELEAKLTVMAHDEGLRESVPSSLPPAATATEQPAAAPPAGQPAAAPPTASTSPATSPSGDAPSASATTTDTDTADSPLN